MNEEILAGIRERMSEDERCGLLSPVDVVGLDGKSLFNALKQNPGRATWSNFKRLKSHLEWVDELGESGKWIQGVATGKVVDFAGEAEAQDAATLKDYTADRRVALIACLAAKARMRAREDLTTMFCKRMAAKAKKRPSRNWRRSGASSRRSWRRSNFRSRRQRLDQPSGRDLDVTSRT
ncbi:hypothetical protein [Streptomyces sp. XH2]|uniref:hypothetical protein n=1 Tax=Streptomyces sp. XH2 TaxID=3412483 RepID=UPI003C7E9BF6